MYSTLTSFSGEGARGRSILVWLCIACAFASAARAQCPEPANPGPYAAGWTTANVTRGARTFNTTIYYPASVAGNNASPATAAAPYPMIAFGHGFMMQPSYYTSYFEHLASHGYMVIAPQFPDTQHGELALDLLACLQFLRSQGCSTSSWMYQLVDTSRAGMSGHSMGGGACLLAASYDSRVRVAAPMCPAETTPSCIQRMAQIPGAVTVIAGSADGITPLSSNAQPMYNASNPYKSLVVLQGGNHTRCMDVSTFDWTDPGGSMDRSTQQFLTRRYMKAVFDLWLKNDTCGWKYTYGVLAPDARIVLSTATREQVPSPFALVPPMHFGIDPWGGPSPSLLLRWQRARTLDPQDTIAYTVQIRSVTTSPSFAYDTVRVNDTSLTLPPAVIDSLKLFIGGLTCTWRVVARTSPSTTRVCDSNGSIYFTIPVELVSFTGRRSGTEVTLRWETAGEQNNAGFEVQRSRDGMAFETAGFVAGHGSSMEAHTYTFNDRGSDARWYRLRQVDLDGTATLSPVIDVGDATASAGIGMTILPQPVAAQSRLATLRITASGSAPMSLRLSDVSGRLLRTVFDNQAIDGAGYSSILDLRGLAAGQYLAVLTTSGTVIVRCITVLR
jgi:predicted dienelactone hydrolase